MKKVFAEKLGFLPYRRTKFLVLDKVELRGCLEIRKVYYLPSPNFSPKWSYGVHTSLEIQPKAWFSRLVLGCWLILEARHCEEERGSRSVLQTRNRKN